MTIGRKGRKHEETKDMEGNLTQTNTNDEQWLKWL